MYFVFDSYFVVKQHVVANCYKYLFVFYVYILLFRYNFILFLV